MKLDASTQQFVHGFSRIMHRYHVIIFSIIVLGGLAAATFLLYKAATLGESSSTQSSAANFDNSTIERIGELHGVGETTGPIQLPQGRTNPFKE